MTTEEAKKFAEETKRRFKEADERRTKIERRIDDLYLEIAAADTVAVGLAFRVYALAESGNIADGELAKAAFASDAAMSIYEKLNNIAELEYRRYGK